MLYTQLPVSSAVGFRNAVLPDHNTFTLERGLDSVWQPLAQKVLSNTGEIDDLLSCIEKLSKFAERTNQMHENTSKLSAMSISKAIPQKPEEQAKLPCVILPAIRTSRFFDRTDVIEKIDNHFGPVCEMSRVE